MFEWSTSAYADDVKQQPVVADPVNSTAHGQSEQQQQQYVAKSASLYRRNLAFEPSFDLSAPRASSDASDVDALVATDTAFPNTTLDTERSRHNTGLVR